MPVERLAGVDHLQDGKEVQVVLLLVGEIKSQLPREESRWVGPFESRLTDELKIFTAESDPEVWRQAGSSMLSEITQLLGKLRQRGNHLVSQAIE
jgi:hypothetical protein